MLCAHTYPPYTSRPGTGLCTDMVSMNRTLTPPELRGSAKVALPATPDAAPNVPSAPPSAGAHLHPRTRGAAITVRGSRAPCSVSRAAKCPLPGILLSESRGNALRLLGEGPRTSVEYTHARTCTHIHMHTHMYMRAHTREHTYTCMHTPHMHTCACKDTHV